MSKRENSTLLEVQLPAVKKRFKPDVSNDEDFFGCARTVSEPLDSSVQPEGSSSVRTPDQDKMLKEIEDEGVRFAMSGEWTSALGCFARVIAIDGTRGQIFEMKAQVSDEAAKSDQAFFFFFFLFLRFVFFHLILFFSFSSQVLLNLQGFEFEAGESWCPLCEEWGHIAPDCAEWPEED